jgi:hypothetical protein
MLVDVCGRWVWFVDGVAGPWVPFACGGGGRL